MRKVRLLLVAFAFIGAACSGGGGGSVDRDNAKEGEVFLDAFDDVGTDPFTHSVALAAVPPVGPREAATSDQGLRSVRGTTPALYGGTSGQRICDASAAVEELLADDDKAQAWVDALNDDARLSWSGGSKLAADDITTFVTELTSVLLQSDTRVTSYGYRGVSPFAYQSVLQRGTAVMVDTHGVPRARCAGFNPLVLPKPAAKPKYRGEEWDGFDKKKLVSIEPGGVIDSFRIVDVHTKKVVEIPVGQDCCEGVISTTTTTEFLDEETTTTTSLRTTTTQKKTTTTSAKPATTVATTTTVAPTTTAPATTTTEATP